MGQAVIPEKIELHYCMAGSSSCVCGSGVAVEWSGVAATLLCTHAEFTHTGLEFAVKTTGLTVCRDGRQLNSADLPRVELCSLLFLEL